MTTDDEPREIMHEGEPLFTHEDLHSPAPDCDGKIVSASGGGIKCTKCNGWFCY